MRDKNPWTKVSSRLIYENPWIKVREDQVISPTGSPGIYGVVDSRLAIGVVALTDDNLIHMVGQYRYPTDVYSWEIPEGGGEPGESPLQTAQRELREETGLTASRWEQLGGEIHLSNCFTSERAFLFIAKGLLEGQAAPDETEQLSHKKIEVREALRMVEQGQIYDGLTIIALLKVARMLGV